MKDPRTILFDLQTELAGELLSEEVEVRGRKFFMKLLNDSESGWTFSHINSSNQITLALTARLCNLSVGIRSIDGVSIEDLFTPLFQELSDPQQESLLEKNMKSMKFACAELFMDYLKDQPPSFINELQDKWNELESRRIEAQGEVKNSSREGSEKDSKTSMTDPSLDGEE